MAIIVSTNGYCLINSVDLSSWAKSIKVDWGEETRDVSSMGDTQRLYRAGVQTVSAEVTFFNDHAASAPEVTLRGLISTTSTGFPVKFRKLATGTTTVNPMYQGEAILDGSLETLSDEHGEVAEITARFLPYSAWTISTSAS
jgi:hypothetical protein